MKFSLFMPICVTFACNNNVVLPENQSDLRTQFSNVDASSVDAINNTRKIKLTPSDWKKSCTEYIGSWFSNLEIDTALPCGGKDILYSCSATVTDQIAGWKKFKVTVLASWSLDNFQSSTSNVDSGFSIMATSPKHNNEKMFAVSGPSWTTNPTTISTIWDFEAEGVGDFIISGSLQCSSNNPYFKADLKLHIYDVELEKLE